MLLTLLLSAILMAALFLMIIAAVVFIQDKRLFTSAPKDIQEAIMDHDERFAGAHIVGWCLLILAVALFPSVFVYGAWDGLQNGFGFWDFFCRFALMLLLLKAFDILFLDLFLLCHSRFYQHFYPETEGCAGFNSFGFNKKSHLAQTILFVVAAFIGAWVCTLL